MFGKWHVHEAAEVQCILTSARGVEIRHRPLTNIWIILEPWSITETLKVTGNLYPADRYSATVLFPPFQLRPSSRRIPSSKAFMAEVVIRTSIGLVVNFTTLCIVSRVSLETTDKRLILIPKQRGMSERRLAAEIFKYMMPVPQDAIWRKTAVQWCEISTEDDVLWYSNLKLLMLCCVCFHVCRLYMRQCPLLWFWTQRREFVKVLMRASFAPSNPSRCKLTQRWYVSYVKLWQ